MVFPSNAEVESLRLDDDRRIDIPSSKLQRVIVMLYEPANMRLVGQVIQRPEIPVPAIGKTRLIINSHITVLCHPHRVVCIQSKPQRLDRHEMGLEGSESPN